jgi:ABC-type multidrug transport system fused ATPase/permease subunit
LKPRHLFLGILWSNAPSVAVICLFCVISGAAELSGSLGIQKVLEYLENDGEGATFKPIFWILLLFVGPTIGSLAIQGYVYLNTRLLVRSESVLTQLLFDHALRLRMKDSTDDQNEGESSAVPVINVEQVDESGSSDTEVGSSSGSDQAKKNLAARAEEEASKSSGQGLAGKINVLISSDVESILGKSRYTGRADVQRVVTGH